MESTLTLPMSSLIGWTGDYLGWGLGADLGEEAYTTAKTLRAKQYVDAALRMVAFEATIEPGRIPPHQWSWLSPDLAVTIEQGQRSVRLPDDFGGYATESLTVTQGETGYAYAKVKLTSSPYLDEWYAKTSSVSGRPLYAAERWLAGTTPVRSSRYELYIYPEADAAYTFRGPYNMVLDALSTSNPYAPGGAAMAECWKAACRAAAELYSDNRQQGPEWQNYMRSLAAAIQRDGRHHPMSLGINRDMSDPSRGGAGVHWPGDPGGAIGLIGNLTIDGVRPSE